MQFHLRIVLLKDDSFCYKDITTLFNNPLDRSIKSVAFVAASLGCFLKFVSWVSQGEAITLE